MNHGHPYTESEMGRILAQESYIRNAKIPYKGMQQSPSISSCPCDSVHMVKGQKSTGENHSSYYVTMSLTS